MVSLTKSTIIPFAQEVVIELCLPNKCLWLLAQLNGKYQSVVWEPTIRSSTTYCIRLTLLNGSQPLAVGDYTLAVEAFIQGNTYYTTHQFSVVASEQKALESPCFDQPPIEANKIPTSNEPAASIALPLPLTRPAAIEATESEASAYLTVTANPAMKKSLQFARPLVLVIGIMPLIVGWLLFNTVRLHTAPESSELDGLIERLYTGKNSAMAYEKVAILAEQNLNANAQAWMGYRYLTGDGVEKNLHEAKKWYQKAAATGSQEAQKQLIEIDKALLLMTSQLSN